jgi:hypothetical protein
VLAAICQGHTIIARTARAAKNGSPTCGSSCKKQYGECWQFAQKTIWRMLAVCAIVCATLTYRSCLSAICQGTLRDMPKSGKLTPSLSKIRRIWRTCFYIDGCATVPTIALKWPIFEQKKGRATICSGLNYCSMGSSQPPSRDTVPLRWFKKMCGSPCSIPQTLGMTCNIWLQVESSIHSCRASRQPRLELVGVGVNIPDK